MSLQNALLLDPHAFDVWIAHRKDGIKGTGTINDPYDGSTDERFDGIMASLPQNVPVRVHLGPSSPAEPFQTKGFSLSSTGTPNASPAWQPRPGMKIVGSGKDVTFLQLKLPGTPTANNHYFAIGAPTTAPVDFLEVSDLTIDCNLPSGSSVACGAIRVMGNHVRIQRVKCVNWGSRTTAQCGFVVALIIADPDSGSSVVQADDARIEECIAVEPSDHNNVANAVVNIFHIGGRELTDTAVTFFGRGPFIRNCFVDCDSPTPASPATEFRALSMGGCQGGIVEANQIHNTQYAGPYQQRINTREIIVRNNTFRNVVKGPFWNLGATAGIRVEKILVERNTAELVAANVAAPVGPAIGIHVKDNGASAHPYEELILRNNRIRYTDGTPGTFTGYAIDVTGTDALIVENNVVEVSPVNPIRNERCDAVKYFNNETPGGKLILGWESDFDFNYGELTTDAEDAFVLSFMKRR